MASYISKLTVKGTTYDIKDAEARSSIVALEAAVAGGTHFIGITTSDITDGSAVTPVSIDGADVTPKAGDIVIVNKEGTNGLEFIFANGKWYELGSSGSLKALAYKDSASGSYTPEGSVTTADVAVTGTVTTNVSAAPVTGVQATFTGKEGNISAAYTPEGTISGTVTGTSATVIPAYTPEGKITGSIAGTAAIEMDDFTPAGTVSKPNVNVSETSGSALSGATYEAATETLSFDSMDVLTDVSAELAEAPTFTGTAAAPTVKSATTSATVSESDLVFAGEEKAAETLSGTCETVLDQASNKLTFAGTAGTAEGTFTPEAESVAVGDIAVQITNGETTVDLTAPGQTAALVGTAATITVS